MSDNPRWRSYLLKVSLIIALANPIFFVAVLNLNGSLGLSDKAWGNCISTGFLLGVVSILGCLLGEGRHRWKGVLAGCGETALWWFMAVGL